MDFPIIIRKGRNLIQLVEAPAMHHHKWSLEIHMMEK